MHHLLDNVLLLLSQIKCDSMLFPKYKSFELTLYNLLSLLVMQNFYILSPWTGMTMKYSTVFWVYTSTKPFDLRTLMYHASKLSIYIQQEA